MLNQRRRDKVVRRLLTRLQKARQYALESQDKLLELKFREIENELENLINSLPNAMHWEQFRALEHQIDDNIFQKRDKVEEICGRLKLINESIISIKQLSERQQDGGGNRETMSDEKHSEKEKFASKTFLKFEKCFDSLESYELKACYLCLSIFPEKSIVKKKPLIYWWIGEGLISKTNGRTAEEVGEEVFEELITEGFLIPEHDLPHCIVNSCKVHPFARRALMFLAKSLHFSDFDSGWTNPVNGYGRAFLFSGKSESNAAKIDEETLTVFNLTEQYLQLRDWLSKLNSVRVLHLGRWHNNLKYHIEVENEDSTFDPEMKKKAGVEVYLNGLGTQTSLRYLSLRGVSRMTALPPSVAKLNSLEILDLRDCQGLQKLPFDISSLQNLTHLDVSECYLLESMPKGIEKLSALQVLKGFVIGNVRKDPCKLSDLVRLEQLKKLSIRFGNEASGEGDFANFKNFKALQILVISWSGADVSMDSFTVPPILKKLVLRSCPIDTPPKWLSPDQLRTLKKLYIRGGKLCTLNESRWGVKVLILKYMKNFELGREKLREIFPEVEYLEFQRHKNDPVFVWSKAQEKKATTN